MTKIKFAFLAAACGLFSGPSEASHFITCGFEADVISIQNLGRLNGVIITRQGLEDLEQTVQIKITKVEEQQPHKSCQKVGAEVQLYLKKELQGKYKPGDKLKLDYRNVGDAMGSRISWDIVG